MKFGRIALTFGIVAILAGAYYYMEIVKADEERKEAKESSKAINIEPDKVVFIDFTTPDKETLRLEKKNGEWIIKKPILTKADDDAVSLLLTTASYMRTARVIGSVSRLDIKSFGLDNPRKVIFGFKDAPPRVLSVGSLNPAGRDYFAIGQNMNKVILVNQGRVSGVLKNLFDLRDKKIFGIPVESVSSFSMTNSAGTIRLERSENKNGSWSLTSPVRAKADSSKVGDILSEITNVTASGFIDENVSDVAQYGLDNPRIKFTITHGAKATVSKLLIGDRTPGGSGFYAMAERGKKVVRVPASVAASFPPDVMELRDWSIITFDKESTEKVTIETDGAITQLERARLISAGTGAPETFWEISKPVSGKANGVAVASLLYDLENAKAVDIASADSGDPLPYGLDTPSIKITLTDATGKHVLALSEQENRGTTKYYSKLLGDKSIFEITENDYKSFSKGYRSYTYRKLFDSRSDEVGRILIRRLGQVFEIKKTDNDYILLKPTKGKIDSSVYNRIVWTVLGLEYADETDLDDKEKMGFADPLITISVYNVDDRLTDTLSIGSKVKGGEYYYLTSAKRKKNYLIKEVFVTERIINAITAMVGS